MRTAAPQNDCTANVALGVDVPIPTAGVVVLCMPSVEVILLTVKAVVEAVDAAVLKTTVTTT